MHESYLLDHDLLIKILGKINALQTPSLRCWGPEEQPIKPMVFLEMMSNDFPERCSNTCTTLNESFTHRWRYSCKFDEVITPSCLQCEIKHVEESLVPSSIENSINPVKNALTGGQEVWLIHIFSLCHPMTSKMDALLTPIELSFDMIKNSIECLHQFVSKEMKKNPSLYEKHLVAKYSHKYLQLTGFSTSLVKGLVDDIMSGMKPTTSEHYPLILKHYNKLGIELKHFQTMPIHLCFLGIEKI